MFKHKSRVLQKAGSAKQNAVKALKQSETEDVRQGTFWERYTSNECGNYGLSILLSLGDTDDEELFEICVDSLRAFSSTSDKEEIADGNAQFKL